jgi:taurine dioxygenase
MATATSVKQQKFTLNKLPRMGVSVADLKIEDIDDPELRKQLYDLYVQEGLILFKGLFGRDTLVKLSRVFGDLQDAPLSEWHTENPEVMEVRYAPETGWRMELNGKEVGGWQPWHTDGVYTKTPNRGGIITCVKMPSEEGGTGFIDKMESYDLLPEDIKEKIDPLYAIYNIDAIEGFERPRFGQQAIKTIHYAEETLNVYNRRHTFPEVAHPLVITQAETGRKMLNLCPLFVQRIEGMDKEESDGLLRFLVPHATDPNRAYIHYWEPGDMVLWDNYRSLHCATGAPADEVRLMEKTFILGDYKLGREL